MALNIIFITYSLIQCSVLTNGGEITNEKAKEREISDEVSFTYIPEDGRLDFMELARKCGYDSEVFHITTEDGYVLKLDHIPGDRTRPVLLVHGLGDSSNAYILRKEESLAINLAKQNFNVWVMNVRGNRYSRRHITLDPDKDNKQFFNYSFHEIGLFDVPAVIDFVLNSTGADRLGYVGHSQGTTAFMVMASERPEYNDKVTVVVMLAPSAFYQHIQGLGPLFRSIEKLIYQVGSAVGMDEVVNHNATEVKLMRYICSMGQLTYEMCIEFVFYSIGYSPRQMTSAIFKLILGQAPSGTSLKAAMHYVQLFSTKYFRKYDYGDDNISIYGSKTPPSYNLNKVTAKIALIYSLNDRMIAVKDVYTLSKHLPNIVKHHLVEDNSWNHIDYLWAKDVNKYVNPYVISLLKQYS